MLWIGLTGGIATGKTCVAKILLDQGFTVIDADQIAREVVAESSEALDRVLQVFGPDVIDKGGGLNRFRLGAIVFSDPEKRQSLEEILHPLINERIEVLRRQSEDRGLDVAFCDIPLLYEKEMAEQFDRVVFIYASINEQRRRLKERNNYTDEEIEQRLSSQMYVEDKRAKADYTINNLGTQEELEIQVKAFLSKMSF